jgi:hypothetical protein
MLRVRIQAVVRVKVGVRAKVVVRVKAAVSASHTSIADRIRLMASAGSEAVELIFITLKVIFSYMIDSCKI